MLHPHLDVQSLVAEAGAGEVVIILLAQGIAVARCRAAKTLGLSLREEEEEDKCRPRHVPIPSDPSLMRSGLPHNCITMTLSTGPHLSARDMRIVLEPLIAEQASGSLESCHSAKLIHYCQAQGQ